MERFFLGNISILLFIYLNLVLMITNNYVILSAGCVADTTEGLKFAIFPIFVSEFPASHLRDFPWHDLNVVRGTPCKLASSCRAGFCFSKHCDAAGFFLLVCNLLICLWNYPPHLLPLFQLPWSCPKRFSSDHLHNFLNSDDSF